MKTIHFVRKILFIAVFIKSTSIWAFDIHQAELSFAAGSTVPVKVNGVNEVSSPAETDVYTPLSTNFSFIYRVGVGYHLFNDQLKNNMFFNDLLMQVSLSHNTSSTIDGVADKYIKSYWSGSYYNSMDFNSTISTNTLLLELKPSLFIVNNLSPYLIVGAGEAWSDVSLNDVPDSNPWSSLHNTRYYSSHMNANFAYELGFGVKTTFQESINVNGELVYTDIGTVHPQKLQGFDSAPAFSISNMSFLLGVIWKL